jgi:hypothetical protein
MPPILMARHVALLPEHLLHTEWFAVLAAFVALNTIMYCALAVSKVLPKLYVSDWIHSPNRRSQTRSIYPEGFVHPADRPDVEPHRELDPVA